MTAEVSASGIQKMSPVVPGAGFLRPLGLDEVRITGGFWASRQTVNASATLPAIAGRLESEGWIGNFDLTASDGPAHARRGPVFADSEIYKFLEAAAWELGRCPSAELEAVFTSYVRRVAAAQQPDGYLNTAFGGKGQPPRWSDLAWGHELYCLGHLFQAAVARHRTAPKAGDGLFEVALRAADLVCRVFGQDGIDSVCGHPEIELGLAELARASGRPEYMAQAKLFVDRRGHGRLPDIGWGRSYYQDDLPIRAADAERGHAVRANYLGAGATDVAVDTGDQDLLDALARQWQRTLERRTYITGGQGSRHEGEEFGEDWELPPDRAYAETCAAVGSVMYGWRLLLATGDLTYADQIERCLFNIVATAVSEDGARFFYANTLHQRTPGVAPDAQEPSPRAASSLRAPWFAVSCCPPNIARTLASWAAYLATVGPDGVQVLQYAPAAIRTTLEDGTVVAVDIETDYPDSGVITLVVRRSSERPWTLDLRVPGWAREDGGATLVYRPVGGGESVTRSGGPVIGRTAAFSEGDVLELSLPMRPRFVWPDRRVDAVRGCVAVQYGPVVYCAQALLDDREAPDLTNVVVDTGVEPRLRQGVVEVAVWQDESTVRSWPYGVEHALPAELTHHGRPGILRLLPYHDWGEAGLCTMRVWLPASAPETC